MKWVAHERYVLQRIGKFLANGTEQAISRSIANHRRKFYWRRWYAWRPVVVAESKLGSIVTPAHYVWLEYVDCRRKVWWLRTYRPNILDYDQYETTRDEYSQNGVETKKFYKTWSQLVIEAANG